MKFGKNQFRPAIEALETRELLAAHLQATLSHGLLKVEGTNRADNIQVRQDGDQISVWGMQKNALQVVKIRTSAGKLTGVSADSVTKIQVLGLKGNDTISLDQGTQSIECSALLNGGPGNDSLVGGAGDDTLLGGAGRDAITIGMENADRAIGWTSADSLFFTRPELVRQSAVLRDGRVVTLRTDDGLYIDGSLQQANVASFTVEPNGAISFFAKPSIPTSPPESAPTPSTPTPSTPTPSTPTPSTPTPSTPTPSTPTPSTPTPSTPTPSTPTPSNAEVWKTATNPIDGTVYTLRSGSRLFIGGVFVLEGVLDIVATRAGTMYRRDLDGLVYRKLNGQFDWSKVHGDVPMVGMVLANNNSEALFVDQFGTLFTDRATPQSSIQPITAEITQNSSLIVRQIMVADSGKALFCRDSDGVVYHALYVNGQRQPWARTIGSPVQQMVVGDNGRVAYFLDQDGVLYSDNGDLTKGVRQPEAMERYNVAQIMVADNGNATFYRTIDGEVFGRQSADSHWWGPFSFVKTDGSASDHLVSQMAVGDNGRTAYFVTYPQSELWSDSGRLAMRQETFNGVAITNVAQVLVADNGNATFYRTGKGEVFGRQSADVQWHGQFSFVKSDGSPSDHLVSQMVVGDSGKTAYFLTYPRNELWSDGGRLDIRQETFNGAAVVNVAQVLVADHGNATFYRTIGGEVFGRQSADSQWWGPFSFVNNDGSPSDHLASSIVVGDNGRTAYFTTHPHNDLWSDNGRMALQRAQIDGRPITDVAQVVTADHGKTVYVRTNAGEVFGRQSADTRWWGPFTFGSAYRASQMGVDSNQTAYFLAHPTGDLYTDNGNVSVPLQRTTNIASGFVIDGVLQITGSNELDRIQVRRLSDEVYVDGALVFVDGVASVSLPASLFSRIDVYGRGGDDILWNNTDIISNLHGGSGNDTIIGGRNNDNLYGDAGNDVLRGDDGFDTYRDDFLPSQYVIDGFNSTDIQQRLSPTCTILSTLASATNLPGYLASHMRYMGNNQYTVDLYTQGGFFGTSIYRGAWGVTFDGEWTDNDAQPPVGTDGVITGEFWPLLYQRAVLQKYGVNWRDQDTRNWGTWWQESHVAMLAIAGDDDTHDSPGTPTELRAALDRGNVVTAGDRFVLRNGVWENHIYAVLDVFQVSGQWRIRLYNPWGDDRIATLGTPIILDLNNDGLISLSWAQYQENFVLYCTSDR